MNLPSIIEGVLARHEGKWTPKDRAVLLQVAQSSLNLTFFASRGHDIGKDLPQLEAQAASIAAAEAHVTRGILREVLNIAIDAVLSRVIPGAA